MKKYTLVIDHESCWGCKTCEVACKQEFNVPDDVRLISVLEDGPKMVYSLDATHLSSRFGAGQVNAYDCAVRSHCVGPGR